MVGLLVTPGYRARRGPLPEFDFGPERAAYEERWTPELQDAILAATMGCQTTMRNFLRARLFERLEQHFEAGETVLPDDIREEELTIRASS